MHPHAQIFFSALSLPFEGVSYIVNNSPLLISNDILSVLKKQSENEAFCSHIPVCACDSSSMCFIVPNVQSMSLGIAFQLPGSSFSGNPAVRFLAPFLLA